MPATLFERTLVWRASPSLYDYFNHFHVTKEWSLGGGQSVDFVGSVALCDVRTRDPPEGAEEAGVVRMVLKRQRPLPQEDVEIVRDYVIYRGAYTFPLAYASDVTFDLKCVFDQPPAPYQAARISLRTLMESSQGRPVYRETEFYGIQPDE
jgi:hypothetical protein